MSKSKNILGIFSLFCSISYANIPPKPEPAFTKDSFSFAKVIKSLGIANSSVSEPLRWGQIRFSFDVDDDGEVDAVAMVSQSTGPRQIFIHTYLDGHGRQMLLSVIEPQAINMTNVAFVRTKNGKWVSDKSDQNYAVWMEGLLSFVDSVGGPEKYLKIQTEFLRKLLEYYKNQLDK